MYTIFNWFLKITGWTFPLICRQKIYYEDPAVQGRRIKGKAIISSNHNHLLDFGALLYTFPGRAVRCVMSEALYRQFFLLTWFMHAAGGIKADRETYDFSFITKCRKVLDRGGVVEIYPEGKIPDDPDEPLMPFKPSVVLMALEADAPIIPVYVNGKYFSRRRLRVMIGKPLYVSELYDEKLSERENIANITEYLRSKTIELKDELQRQVDAEAAKKKK